METAESVHGASAVLVKLAHISMYEDTSEPNHPYRLWLTGEYKKLTRPEALGLLSKLKRKAKK